MCALRGGFFSFAKLRTRESLAPLLRLTQNIKESEKLNKKSTELEKQRKATEKELKQEQHKLKRLQNRETYLKQAQRKQRNKRLDLKGVAVESIIPSTKYLSQVEFYSLTEQIYQLDSVKKLVENATAEHREMKEGD